MIGSAKWHLSGDSPGSPALVNLCMSHDPALAGLHRGVVAFATGLEAPILSVEPAHRLYAPDTGNIHRLEAKSGLALIAAQYLNESASAAVESLLHDTNLLVVHSLFRGHADLAMRWAAGRRKAYWVVPHGCWDPWGMAHHRIRKEAWMVAVGHRYVANADWVIFASRREAEKAARWTRGARITVAHFPVSLPDLARRDVARQSLRKKLGIPDGDRVLMYAGRLHSMKRPHSVLQAFLQAEIDNVTLVFVGRDDDVTRAELASAVPSFATGRVRFTGSLDGKDLDEAFLAADGLISLSYRENFGFSVAEACAYALPIIVTPGHDLAHDMPTGLGTGNGVGWLLPDLSEAAAAQAIREFATTSEGQLRNIGQTGRRWVADQLSPSDFRDRLKALMPC